jgi:hypothetical protein
MDVQFREFDPFNLWVWLEFETIPSPMEQQYIEELFQSWFYLGKLGGFNAENLQVQDMGIDLSYMDYDQDQADRVMMAPMHNMSDFEYQGTWGRCWFDLGTSDPLAVDILINALTQLSQNFVQVKRIIFGGQNEDWQAEARQESMFVEN